MSCKETLKINGWLVDTDKQSPKRNRNAGNIKRMEKHLKKEHPSTRKRMRVILK